MDDKRKASGISYFFTLKSGFNFSSSSSKIQILLDVLAKMALLGALHKKLQLHKGHVFQASKSMSSTSQKKQIRPVSGKGSPVSLFLITLYDNFLIIVILSPLRKNEYTSK